MEAISPLEEAGKMPAETEELRAATSELELQEETSAEDLANVLEQHQIWVDSQGEEGERAELCGADLAGAELTGANLQGALLRKANLKGAELLLADLRGTCLMQANLEGANLLGADFRGANLQSASLEGATGLLAGKLAGTNLFGAALPKPVSEFGELEYVAQTSKSAGRLLAALCLVCACTDLIVVTTTDAQLLKNSASLPLPFLRDALPMLGFYLFVPVLLLGFYIFFHFYLHRLWNALAELPAIFPDGRAVNRTGPRLLMELGSRLLPWCRENRPALSFLETGIATLLGYWLAPATLVLFWARYLTRQDLHGTLLHVALVVAAVATAMLLPEYAGRGLCADYPQPPRSDKATRPMKLSHRAGIALGTGGVLMLLSLGTIYGVRHDGSRASDQSIADIRRWASDALWAVGYSPFADVSETDISLRPKNWSGREEELGLVKGARLNGLSMRYAEAYRVFLANAHLLKADLKGAYLAEADLRGAILRQASLEAAVLDRALLTRANLQGARLRKANLVGAELREADLTYSSLVEAVLVGARLEGANLYGADLRLAQLLRANLAKADLRDANLEEANLALADLREAYLWSAKLSGAKLHDAQLQRAILIEADLRNADLRGADLQGAVLRGANLSGAQLEGADLRGATGVEPGQICSAMLSRGPQLDEGVQHVVESQCGTLK